MAQDAYADTTAQFDAPEFSAYHINTTATHVQFDQPVNGTLALADWGIRYISTATAGDITYDVAISNIANSSTTGIGLTAPSQDDKDQSSLSTSPNVVVGLGFINGSDIVLIHAAIPSDVTYYVNYTGNPSMTGNYTGGTHQTTIGGSGHIHSSGIFITKPWCWW